MKTWHFFILFVAFMPQDALLYIHKKGTRMKNGTNITADGRGKQHLFQDQAGSNLLSQFLPGLIKNVQAGRDSAAGSQLVGELAQNIPGLNTMPGIGSLSSSHGSSVRSSASSDPIGQFAEPLIKFASGATPQLSDIGKILTSLPNLVVRVPNFGDVDVSKLSPSIVEHVLHGGQIPGIPREALDLVVKKYMERVYAAAASAQGMQSTTEYPLPAHFNRSLYLRPLTELPPSIIRNVLQGRELPHLSEDKTKVIKDYYTQQIPIPKYEEQQFNITDLIPPKLLGLMSLLPPDYPINKIPPEALKTAIAGQLPDFASFPDDLQLYIRNNINKLFRQQQNIPGFSPDELISHMPFFERPQMPTFSPYDINRVDSELVVQNPEKTSAMRLYTALALGLISAVTLSLLTGFCLYLRNKKNESAAMSSDTAIVSMPDKVGTIADVVREQSFRPSASSTLRSMH